MLIKDLQKDPNIACPVSEGMRRSSRCWDPAPAPLLRPVDLGGCWEEKHHPLGRGEQLAVDVGCPSPRPPDEWQRDGQASWDDAELREEVRLSEWCPGRGDRDKGARRAPHSRTARFAPDAPILPAGRQTAHRISLLQSRRTSILHR